MTPNDFQMKVVEPLAAEIQHIFATKGVDYASPTNRFANFERVGAKLDISPIKVAGVYLYKHLDSLDTWLKTGTLKGEPIEAKLVDIIAYAHLIYGMAIEVSGNTIAASAENEMKKLP